MNKSTSRSVRFHETGGPEVLKIEEVATLFPGAGQVRIRVKAIGLNRAESMYRSGAYLYDPVFPAQLGYEAAGEIEAVGSDVVGLAPGDKVSVIPSFTFLDYGLYGELVLAPAKAIVKHPVGLSWVEAAAIWMQYATAWGALIDIAKLKKGEVILVPAASSSVGIASIQIANLVGAIPVALTRTSAKTRELKEAGAAHVVATEEQDLVAEALRLTNGKGARVVFDPVGGPTFQKLAQATAVGGILFIYGALSPETTPLPALAAIGRHLTIRGYQVVEVIDSEEKIEEMKRFIVEGLASGALRPRIAKTFPFEQIVEAHRYLESNTQVGKVVVVL